MVRSALATVGHHVVAALLLVALAAGAVGAGWGTGGRPGDVRLWFQPSTDCRAPYLTVHLEPIEDRPTCGARPGPSMAWNWAHDGDGPARGGTTVWFDTLRGLPLRLDAHHDIEGVIEVESSVYSALVASGDIDLYLWVQAGPWRFGGLAYDGEHVTPTVASGRNLPVRLPIPDALHGVTVDRLRVGVERAGLHVGHEGIQTGGASWLDVPILADGDAVPTPPTPDCPPDAQLTGTRAREVVLEVEHGTEGSSLDLDAYRFEVTFDLRAAAGRADGPVQVDLLGVVRDRREGAADRQTGVTDLNLHVEQLGMSILIQPWERGDEYVAGALPVCGTLDVTVYRPWLQAPSVAEIALTLLVDEPAWPAWLLDKPLPERAG